VKRFSSLAIAFFMVAAAADGQALDGIAITTRAETGAPHSLHSPNWGNIIRHDIRGGKVTASAPIYTGGDAGFACISPMGDQAAFLRRDGSVAVVGINGGDARVLVQRGGHRDKEGNLPGAVLHIAWPYGENGRCVYFLANPDSGGNARLLRRVDVKTGDSEDVVTFNMDVNGFALSLYATPSFGTFACRPTARMHICYDMAEGTGDLYNAVPFPDACGVSVSPDGTCFTANDTAHRTCRIVDTNGNVRSSFRVNQYEAGLDASRFMWQHFRWSVNAQNWIMATQGEVHQHQDMKFLDAVLYNWIEGRQIAVTANKPGQFDLAGGFWSSSDQIDLPLGLHVGKAPFAVKFPRPADAKLRWNYGNGKADGEGETVYTEGGSFEVAASDGRLTWRGRVTARPARAPGIRRAFPISSEAFYVAFDEQMQLTDRAKIAFASGAVIREVILDPNRRDLVVVGDVRNGDELLLDGIKDTGQPPRIPQPSRVRVVPDPWPADRNGLVFIWQNAKATNVIDWPRREYSRLACLPVYPRGSARLSHCGSMDVRGGAFAVGDVWQAMRRCTQTNQATFELVFQPTHLRQTSKDGAAVIAAFASSFGNFNLWIGQDADKLAFGIRTAQTGGRGSKFRRDITTLADASRRHLVLSYKSGRLLCVLDGKIAAEFDDIDGGLNWEPNGLNFGDIGNGSAPWHGSIEYIAVYNRALGADEARANHEAVSAALEGRPDAPRADLTAKLKAISAIPTLKQTAPYRDALVAAEYAIEAAPAAGKAAGAFRGLAPGGVIRVLHWGMLNGQPTAIAGRKPGGVYALILEPGGFHPEMEQEYRSDTLPPDLGVPEFFDVGM